MPTHAPETPPAPDTADHRLAGLVTGLVTGTLVACIPFGRMIRAAEGQMGGPSQLALSAPGIFDLSWEIWLCAAATWLGWSLGAASHRGEPVKLARNLPLLALLALITQGETCGVIFSSPLGKTGEGLTGVVLAFPTLSSTVAIVLVIAGGVRGLSWSIAATAWPTTAGCPGRPRLRRAPAAAWLLGAAVAQLAARGVSGIPVFAAASGLAAAVLAASELRSGAARDASRNPRLALGTIAGGLAVSLAATGLSGHRLFREAGGAVDVAEAPPCRTLCRTLAPRLASVPGALDATCDCDDANPVCYLYVTASPDAGADLDSAVGAMVGHPLCTRSNTDPRCTLAWARTRLVPVKAELWVKVDAATGEPERRELAARLQRIFPKVYARHLQAGAFQIDGGLDMGKLSRELLDELKDERAVEVVIYGGRWFSPAEYADLRRVTVEVKFR